MRLRCLQIGGARPHPMRKRQDKLQPCKSSHMQTVRGRSYGLLWPGKHCDLNIHTCMQIQALLVFQISSTPVYGHSEPVGSVSLPVDGSTNTALVTCSAQPHHTPPSGAAINKGVHNP
jgi:hypothetical protein